MSHPRLDLPPVDPALVKILAALLVADVRAHPAGAKPVELRVEADRVTDAPPPKRKKSRHVD
jgi:hypothetical protein